MLPKTQYARSAGSHIAFQVFGDGPVDLLFAQGWVSHMECQWEFLPFATFLQRLGSIARIITFDKRGVGMSDRVETTQTLEERVNDVRAVLDAAKSNRTVMLGASEGFATAAMFSATDPQRVLGLVSYGGWVKRLRSKDAPWAPTLEMHDVFYRFLEDDWGNAPRASGSGAAPIDPQTGEPFCAHPCLAGLLPSHMNDREFVEAFLKFVRRSASPGAAVALARMNTHLDVSGVLPVIRVPTLVMHRRADHVASIQEGRYIAAHIPGAKFVELDGGDHLPFIGQSGKILDVLGDFIKQLPKTPAAVPALVTLAFIDGDESANMKDQMKYWLREQEGTLVFDQPHYLLARFDGPLRAIQFCCAVRDHARDIKTSMRAVVDVMSSEATSEKQMAATCERFRRLAAYGSSNTVLATAVAKGLVAGSRLTFDDLGSGPVHAQGQTDVAPFQVGIMDSTPERTDTAIRLRDHLHQPNLTRAQIGILQLVAQGRTNGEIARLLSRSEHTVHRHVANILAELDVTTRAAAVAYATRLSII
jgi:pimeloyl-ACP methyl ester carboxylesterase/DNA-binding NarL/FixJ family response regulator